MFFLDQAAVQLVVLHVLSELQGDKEADKGLSFGQSK